MRYQKLGNSGIDVSVIAHGTWAMGNDFFGDVDKDRAIRAIHASVEHGVNLVDTARAYGEDCTAEKVVGEAICGMRDKVVLATKVGVLRAYGGNYVKCSDPNVMRCELEESLRNLRTDYIDLYQIHWPDHNTPLAAALETMLRFKEEGKIRAIGVSNFSVAEMQVAVDVADIASVQPPLSLLNRQSFEDGVLDFCAQNGLGVLTYGSLGGGILSGKMDKIGIGGNELRGSFYPYYEEPMWSKCQQLLKMLKEIADARNVSVAQVSINWVLCQRGVTCALLGATRPQTAIENANAADWELTKEELAVIDAAYESIMG
ncbi:MAG: aldo/keto reductase [Christensenella sp.]|uniref:aldo/keto reductase n=1 Tax=Christensenella sp. TaxID=1935934 RepID=UPI002B1F0054|nr:aldo/keto reductase [Christensenella sp.]MEA5003149.1 aldo/keto reductase [Christensenella sp.]